MRNKMNGFTWTLVIVLGAIPLFSLIIFLSTLFSSKPEKPEITYGEFPFRLEYLHNGELKVVEDVLICEYDGVGWSETNGKYRKWKEHLKSGNERVVLLKTRVIAEIYYDPGPADYYMGDYDQFSLGDTYSHPFPNAVICETGLDSTDIRGIKADELLQWYGIRLLKWEYIEPIVNHFSK